MITEPVGSIDKRVTAFVPNLTLLLKRLVPFIVTSVEPKIEPVVVEILVIVGIPP